jgi:threonine/homoserine/homoserine lactone efflux protein
MTESIITISIVGLLAGFIFSMPVAGPVSILITCNAFKGRRRYCNSVNLGASCATFTYAFFAVFGLSKLYSYYKPAIPYLFSAGSIFLLILGYRIFRTDFDIECLEENNQGDETTRKGRSGFYTGFMVNFLNPALFIGWLTSTFLVISFVASFGFKTGGLDLFVHRSVSEINSIEVGTAADSEVLPLSDTGIIKTTGVQAYQESEENLHPNFHLVISVFYALFIASGSVLWFYILVLLIARFRKYFNLKIISALIKSAAVILSLFGLYFGYLSARLLINLYNG